MLKKSVIKYCPVPLLYYKTIEQLKEQPEQEGLLPLWCLSAVNKKSLQKSSETRGEECDSKRDLEEAAVSNEQGNFVWMVKSRSIGRNELSPEDTFKQEKIPIVSLGGTSARHSPSMP